MYVIVAVLPLVLIIAALADIITRDDSSVKHLPKFVWILLVVLLPLIGSILWFAIGHDYGARQERGSFGDPRRWASSSGDRTGHRLDEGRGQYNRSSARSTEQELADLEREIEFYDNLQRIQALEAEIETRRNRSASPDMPTS